MYEFEYVRGRHSLVAARSSNEVSSLSVPGQGCTPDSSRAAEIFTDLSMKGHPYAQV